MSCLSDLPMIAWFKIECWFLTNFLNDDVLTLARAYRHILSRHIGDLFEFCEKCIFCNSQFFFENGQLIFDLAAAADLFGRRFAALSCFSERISLAAQHFHILQNSAMGAFELENFFDIYLAAFLRAFFLHELWI